jgi:FtsP/CotA-like multicopper oxidase with cupredoxin domain/plastocyanin
MDHRRLTALLTVPGRFSRRSAVRRLTGAAVAAGGGVGFTRTAPALEMKAAQFWPVAASRLHEFTLTASEFDWPLMEDTVVRAWGYNGQVPGPEIRVREGDRVRITLVNELPVPTTIHWHGVNVPNGMDGVAGLNQAPVDPGASFVYDFVATPAGTRWYHSHTDAALQVALGLYGPLIVEPRVGGETYDRDDTYILAEWDAELTPAVAAGTAPRGPGDRGLRGGELGSDYFLMNGRMQGAVPPIVVKTGERVLIRLVNAGSLPHAFHIHGHSFQIVATDGNSVPTAARLTRDTVLIGPAERYDLALTANNPGVWLVHCHMEHHMANGMMTLLAYEGYQPTGPAAAFYDAAATPPAPGPASDGAMPTATLTATPAATASPFMASATGATSQVAMLDDRFDPRVLTVAAGTTVVWTNKGQNWHSVAAFDGSFQSNHIAPGASFSHRFNQPGHYQYICQHHVMQGMTGTIEVA